MWFISLLVLILMLGIIILVHEFGHFYWAKKFGVHIEEFSIGMGPVIHTHKGKDGINYNIRAIPIGGFVAMAGEVLEDNKDIPKDKFMCNKPWWQRIIILAAGVTNNFILALIVLFIGSLIWTGQIGTTTIFDVNKDMPMAKAGVVKGDKILAINNHKVNNWDAAQIILFMKDKDKTYTFKIENKDGKIKDVDVKPQIIKEKDGSKREVFGFSVKPKTYKGFFQSIVYSSRKFGTTIQSMWLTITGLITNKLSMNSLSGPVGIYNVVNDSVKLGAAYVMYILMFLSINVGFINILPFPAFDGGRILFVLIEKIKGSPVNPKIENTIHSIGFILLMLLMVYITIKDIIKIF